MTRALLILLALASTSVRAQPSGVRADAVADRAACALSETVRVTLALEGPAPLRVELPKMLLTADADSAWRVRADGEARITALPNNRERWEQRLRLDPYVEGAPLVASFAPVKANGEAVTFPAIRVTVEKKVGANTAVLPVTPPEDPPAPPDVERANPLPWSAGAVALVCFVLAFVVWKRSQKVPVVPPLERALADLVRADSFEHISAVLRAFLERQHGVPALKFTTNEVLAAVAPLGWPQERADGLRELLDECDRAKFAGDVPDDAARADLARRAAEWLAAPEPATAPAPQ
jgi:hypothetical protein